MLTNELKKNP